LKGEGSEGVEWAAHSRNSSHFNRQPWRPRCCGTHAECIPSAVQCTVDAQGSGPATDLDFRIRALVQVAAGNVEVGDDSVRLEVTLPWLLHKFGETVQKTTAGQSQILLEKKLEGRFRRPQERRPRRRDG
jgi:hypothetical protein